MKKKQNLKQIKGVVDELISKWEKSSYRKANAIMAAWILAAGEETSKKTHPINLKNGILIILVENSSWLYKLTLEKKQLIESFNSSYTGRKKIQDIRFRIGTLEEL